MAATEITFTKTREWQRPIADTYSGEGTNDLTGGGTYDEVFWFNSSGFNGFSIETHPSADGTLRVYAVNDPDAIVAAGGILTNNEGVKIGDDIAVTADADDIRNFEGRYKNILIVYAKTAETAGTITCKVHGS